MNSRLAAAKIICRVANTGQSLTAALDQSCAKDTPNKDRALIQAISYGTLRYYHRLDFILNQLLRKPIKDDEVRALALLGLYQLQYMRVKDHAAVSETVAAAKKKTWAKSLLNAILRSYLRKQQGLEDLADKDKVASHSHPRWMIDLISHNWPQQVDQILAENNQHPPMVLRVNKKFCTRDHYLERLDQCDISAKLSTHNRSAIILDVPVAIDKLPEFFNGWVSVQDSAAQFAAELLEVQPAQRVLDVCAAPGGKAAHILELQPELGKLIAVDVDENRLASVSENLKRLKLQANCVAGDASSPEDWWDGQLFDRILIDAPCSAFGVIRRHPDIKLLRRRDDIHALVELQQTILDKIWSLLKPGGTLLYATCSILKQENEDQIEAFLQRTKDASEWPISCFWGIKQKFGRQILTGDNAMDGFYYARLNKN